MIIIQIISAIRGCEWWYLASLLLDVFSVHFSWRFQSKMCETWAWWDNTLQFLLPMGCNLSGFVRVAILYSSKSLVVVWRRVDEISIKGSYWKGERYSLNFSITIFLIWVKLCSCNISFVNIYYRFLLVKIVEDSDKKRETLLQTFKEHLNNKYDRYAAWFFICEQLNFAVVILQWFLTNGFLKYQFIRYLSKYLFTILCSSFYLTEYTFFYRINPIFYLT